MKIPFYKMWSVSLESDDLLRSAVYIPVHLLAPHCMFLCRLYAFSVNTSASEEVLVQEDAMLDTSGIFNMRWLANTDTPTIALACASGAVDLVELHSEDRFSLHAISKADAHSSTQKHTVRADSDDKAMCTLRHCASEMVFEDSMAASIAVDRNNPGRLCTTSSGGEAACLQVSFSHALLKNIWITLPVHSIWIKRPNHAFSHPS